MLASLLSAEPSEEFTCSPCVCVGSSWYSGFHPESKDLYQGLGRSVISKLSIGVNVVVGLFMSAPRSDNLSRWTLPLPIW